MNGIGPKKIGLSYSFETNQLQLGEGFEQDPYLSDLKAWAMRGQPREKRIHIAMLVANTHTNNVPEISVSEQFISELFPLPPCVTYLNIGRCHSLTTLGNDVFRLNSLRIYSCNRLETLSDHLPHDSSQLTELEFSDCPKLSQLPNNLNHLIQLLLWSCPVDAIPDSYSELITLSIRECANFSTIPNTLAKLESVDIYKCPNFETVPNGLGRLSKLSIDDCPNCRMLPNDLPEGIQISGQFGPGIRQEFSQFQFLAAMMF